MNKLVEWQSLGINDPALQNIALRVAHQLELAAEKVAAHAVHPEQFPLAANPNSFEQVLAKRFNRLPANKRAAASERAMKQIGAESAERLRRFGDLASVVLTKNVAVEDQVQALPFPSQMKISAAQLASFGALHVDSLEMNGGIAVPHPAIGVPTPTPVPQAATGAPTPNSPHKDNTAKCTKLRLRIHKVRCRVETPGPGQDEIVMGGVTIDAAGTTSKVASFKVGDFDDGDLKTYNPPRVFATFDLTKASTFPKYYLATIAMAEEDNGGFPDFLKELLSSIKTAVSKLLATTVTGVAAALGELAGPIGAAVGAIVGALLGWLINALIAWWEDDLLTPRQVSIGIPGLQCSWSGKKDSPERLLEFNMADGGTGHYHVSYDWQLVA